jgi:hypothetical protein
MKQRILYYIDGTDIREVPYTREREESVYPMFYETQSEALKNLRFHLLGKLEMLNERIDEINAELAK